MVASVKVNHNREWNARGWGADPSTLWAWFSEGEGVLAHECAFTPSPSLNACGFAARPREAGRARASGSERLFHLR